MNGMNCEQDRDDRGSNIFAAKSTEEREEQETDEHMEQDSRGMPARGRCTEEFPVDDHPCDERRPIVVARRNIAATFERPHIRRERLTIKLRFFDQRIL